MDRGDLGFKMPVDPGIGRRGSNVQGRAVAVSVGEVFKIPASPFVEFRMPLREGENATAIVPVAGHINKLRLAGSILRLIAGASGGEGGVIKTSWMLVNEDESFWGIGDGGQFAVSTPSSGPAGIITLVEPFPSAKYLTH